MIFWFTYIFSVSQYFTLVLELLSRIFRIKSGSFVEAL